MDSVAQTSPSFLTRVLRWLGDYERALDAQRVDLLARRVVELERRLAMSADLRRSGSELLREREA